MRTETPLRVHWVRHGKVSSHQGDVPVTDGGLFQAEAVGRQLAEEVSPDEDIFFLYAPTRRTRETAVAIRNGMKAGLSNMDVQGGQQWHLFAPAEHRALRSPDLYVGGNRVEMVSSAKAMAEQTATYGIDAERLLKIPFLRGFWEVHDRIGYWVNHQDPPGEDADAAARRVLTFATSLLDLPQVRPRRYICVTHSPIMRAFLRRYLLGQDPGEPGYGESIDMLFAENGSLTLRYREVSVTRP
ncbi:MAG: phosphoglycerate mutase family protein [Ktedonobacteraceae bacterium]